MTMTMNSYEHLILLSFLFWFSYNFDDNKILFINPLVLIYDKAIATMQWKMREVAWKKDVLHICVHLKNQFNVKKCWKFTKISLKYGFTNEQDKAALFKKIIFVFTEYILQEGYCSKGKRGRLPLLFENKKSREKDSSNFSYKKSKGFFSYLKER